jgi:hypothetical protein
VPTDPGEQPVLEPGEDPSKLPFRERVRRLVVPQQ